MQAIIYHRDTPATPDDAIDQTREFASILENSDESDIEEIEIEDIVKERSRERTKISEVANRAICTPETEMIMTYDMGTIANSATDLIDLVNILNSADVRIAVTSVEKVFEPGVESWFRNVIEMVADMEDAVASIDHIEADTSANAKGGRPPLGFERVDGRLTPVSDYDRVCRVLMDCKHGIRTVTGAAEDLGCARSTIRRAIHDRPELYDL